METPGMTNDKSTSEIPEHDRPLEVADPQDTPPSDLAELYPADPELWKDHEIVSTWEAVLLSLGIEPNTIRDLAEQRPYRDPVEQRLDDEVDQISYGQQTGEYNRRTSAIQNAVVAGTLIPIQTNDPRYANHISLAGFVAWAKGKAWSMPAWMLDSGTRQPVDAATRPLSKAREAGKAKTQAKYAAWQARADALHVAHPDWSQLAIAKQIRKGLQVESSTPLPSFKCINNNIKIKS
jgi:hypothetical protein